MRIPYLILMMNGMNQYNQIRVIGEGSTCQVILASNSQGNLYAIKEVLIDSLRST
jgi:serine/threonine protein kinase